MSTPYAPIAGWTNPGEISGEDPIYTRGVDPVWRFGNDNNVTIGDPSITDAGQLGRGNLPSLHGPASATQYVVPDVRRTVALTPEATFQPTSTLNQFRRRLLGSTYNPFILRDEHEEVIEDPGLRNIIGMGPTGSPHFHGVIEEHGPITADALETLGQIRQPMAKPKRSWLRKLLFLPERQMSNLGSFDERTIPAIGQVLVGDDQYRDSVAATGYGNQFVVPDIRRTFDQPSDAPSGVPRDEYGNVVYDKAGYPLSATPLESIPWEIQTTHTASVDAKGSEISQDRVRAGVAHWTEGRPARMPHWFYFEPYDKLAADHPLGHKGMLKNPQISRPIMTKQEANTAEASAAGGPRYYAPAAGMEAAGPQPNTDRQVPQPWDNQLYSPEPGSTMVETGRRIHSWRIG